jgi:transcriptional regulator with XRE-family HTH domain
MEFKDNLKTIRNRRGYTQETLGEFAGLSGSHISHFENGERMPNLNNFVALCRALGCKGGDLVEGL